MKRPDGEGGDTAGLMNVRLLLEIVSLLSNG